MKFMITCDKASTICDKSQYKEASFLERIRLAYHVSICESCNLYVKQNRKMSHLFKLKSADCKKETHSLTNAAKELLKKELGNLKS